MWKICPSKDENYPKYVALVYPMYPHCVWIYDTSCADPIDVIILINPITSIEWDSSQGEKLFMGNRSDKVRVIGTWALISSFSVHWFCPIAFRFLCGDLKVYTIWK